MYQYYSLHWRTKLFIYRTKLSLPTETEGLATDYMWFCANKYSCC